jgi:hypothetical protein
MGTKQFDSIAGLSMGALLGLHVVLGFSITETKMSLLEHEEVLFQAFDLKRMSYGCAPTNPDVVRSMLAAMLARKGFSADTCFADLADRRCVAFETVAYCLETARLVVLGLMTTPQARIIDAVLASMAIPMLVDPVPIGSVHFCDAGLISNTPLDLFSPSRLVALVPRSPPSTSAYLPPETWALRCEFLAHMAMQNAEKHGATILRVPYPRSGVHVLYRKNTPFSAFFALGTQYIAVYAVRAELLGALTVLLCCPSFSGLKQAHGQGTS